MGKTYRRPPIKQHRELEESKYRGRVEKDKKKEKKNKHPKRDIEEVDYDGPAGYGF